MAREGVDVAREESQVGDEARIAILAESKRKRNEDEIITSGESGESSIESAEKAEDEPSGTYSESANQHPEKRTIGGAEYDEVERKLYRTSPVLIRSWKVCKYGEGEGGGRHSRITYEMVTRITGKAGTMPSFIIWPQLADTT